MFAFGADILDDLYFKFVFVGFEEKVVTRFLEKHAKGKVTLTTMDATYVN